MKRRGRERERGSRAAIDYAYFAFVVSYPVVSRSSGVASSGPGNPESRHSLSGAGTNLSVKSREVAIKLTSEKKEDGIVNFLSSLLVWLCFSLAFSPSVCLSSSFCRGAYCKPTVLRSPNVFRIAPSFRSRAGNDITRSTLKVIVQ